MKQEAASIAENGDRREKNRKMVVGGLLAAEGLPLEIVCREEFGVD